MRINKKISTIIFTIIMMATVLINYSKSVEARETKTKDAIITARNTTINLGDKFDRLAKVKAIDDGGKGKDITKSIKIKGSVNTKKAGKYELTYSVKGANGNLVSKVVTVTVRDTKGKTNTTNTPGQSNDAIVKEVIRLCNVEREKQKLSPLSENRDLTRLAMIKAQDMVDNNYRGHISPVLGTPSELLISNGINHEVMGENVGGGQETPAEIMKDWMNSQVHKDNILKKEFTEIGVGYATNKNGDIQWVQLFMKPL